MRPTLLIIRVLVFLYFRLRKIGPVQIVNETIWTCHLSLVRMTNFLFHLPILVVLNLKIPAMPGLIFLGQDVGSTVQK